MKVHTPDRAERLAVAFEGQNGFRVWRMIEDRPVISTREAGGLILATRLYARVFQKERHCCDLTYETIDVGSEIW